MKSPSENFPPLAYLLTYYSRINDSFVTKQTYYDAVANIYLETIQCTVLLPAQYGVSKVYNVAKAKQRTIVKKEEHIVPIF